MSDVQKVDDTRNINNGVVCMANASTGVTTYTPAYNANELADVNAAHLTGIANHYDYEDRAYTG